MGLESLLEPVKLADEQLLRQYTKVSKKFNLYEGRKKYFVGMGLWIAQTFMCSAAGDQLIGDAEFPARMLLTIPDGTCNLYGVVFGIEDESTSETISIDPLTNLYRKFNSVVRLPTFTAGVGLVGKFGADLFNYLTNGEPIDSNSYNCMIYGIGLLSLASSMYIKGTDPKLLDKEPVWKRAYEWVREKINFLVPQPVPQPIPFQAHSTLDNYVQNRAQ